MQYYYIQREASIQYSLGDFQQWNYNYNLQRSRGYNGSYDDPVGVYIQIGVKYPPHIKSFLSVHLSVL